MGEDLFGKLFGDKGYLSQALVEKLYKRGPELITSLRKNIKAKLRPLVDRILLRKRFIIETINDQLKNISQVEHTRVLDKAPPPKPVHCSSENLKKNGFAPKGKQKYLCKGYSEAKREEILRAYQERSSLRGLTRTFGVSRTTVTAWLEKKL